jgi:hypothetical protein
MEGVHIKSIKEELGCNLTSKFSTIIMPYGRSAIINYHSLAQKKNHSIVVGYVESYGP